MFPVAAAAAKAVAPHVGVAALQGAKSLAGFAVSLKAGQWAKEKGFAAMIELDEGVGAGRAAATQARENKAPKGEQQIA